MARHLVCTHRPPFRGRRLLHGHAVVSPFVLTLTGQVRNLGISTLNVNVCLSRHHLSTSSVSVHRALQVSPKQYCYPCCFLASRAAAIHLCLPTMQPEATDAGRMAGPVSLRPPAPIRLRGTRHFVVRLKKWSRCNSQRAVPSCLLGNTGNKPVNTCRCEIRMSDSSRANNRSVCPQHYHGKTASR